MTAIKIGNQKTSGNVFLAPMAGVTDLPFRKICRRLGAGCTFGEMSSSKAELAHTSKSRRRLAFEEEPAPRIVQLIGCDWKALVEAALRAKEAGANIIDFNCGCPARKVCVTSCGAALLRKPELIEEILTALVSEVGLPITLKYRTGWTARQNNALQIGEIAQKAGVSMVTLHGRSRDQLFRGSAEYDTAKKLKEILDIPVVVNGDIDSVEKALYVMEYTKADAIMIGRGALGNPWIFTSLNCALNGLKSKSIRRNEVINLVIEHLREHCRFYGEKSGVKSFRKHLNWYLSRFKASEDDIQIIYKIQTQDELVDSVEAILERLDLNVV